LELLSMSDTTDLNNIDGNVKWFDPRKGYGFIVGPQGQDIFVHFSVIDQVEGFKTLRDGESVNYSASKGQKGWSAMKVKSTRVATTAKAPQAS
jgi:CspA family cold shock protein